MPLVIQEHVPLAPFTTLGVGGPARYYTRAVRREEVAEAADWALTRRQALLVLGGGSNLLIADEGWPGLVLHVAVRGVESEADPTGVALSVGAGEPWDDLVSLAVDKGWAGFECLSGIPGLVGATPIQNVGAYGQDVAETITAVDAVELATGRTATIENAACRFGYRDSRFKAADRGRYAIVGVRYRLRPGVPATPKYPDLLRALGERGITEPSLADVRASVLSVRRRKSMVVDPGDPFSRSVGSFFMNPVARAADVDAAEENLRRRGHLAADENMPRYPAPPDNVKVPAAWLIERSGLPRGVRRGPVGLSPNHALAIVNHGGATAAEIASFAREVRDRVRDRTGFILSPEPVFVGLSF
jgi:UDP-N-acetylmuramate dehydrogenase